MILSTLSVVNGVLERHWKEFKSSAISDTIIRLNFRTIEDSRELDKILNRNTKSRHKHSDHLVPAWCVSGVDPLTGENTLEGVQVKPDTPPSDRKGKPQKYIGATGANTAPLFLNTGIEDFWKGIIEDKSQPIIITEGAKKAGAGISLGIPTISIPGVSTCRKFGRLHYWLESFAGFGRTFYLCFDADIVEKRPVQNALISLARDLSATGSKVMIITLPDISLKGLDDFIATKGGNEFRKLIEEATTIEEWKKELDEKRKAEEFDFDGEERKSKLYRAYKIVREGWGDSIRLNLLKKQIELDDSTMDLDQLKFDIAENFDMDVSKEDSLSIVMAIAKRSAYNPVVDYLNSLAERYPSPDTSILDNLALKYFGSADPLHNTYIRKTLIAAVARARQPGCKADDACILVGTQGLRKSTFWQELFGTDWFTDELSDSSEKDELMKLHQFWGLELPEIEHIYKRKDVGSIKKFLSSRTDVFRYPYDRQIKEQPRSCILVGTSNEQELLNDPTGNRRFLIIPVSQLIPVDELVRERDLIWAAANHLYQMGHLWYLTHAEYALQAEANKEYQSSDPWEEIVLPYIQCKGWATTHDILLNALGVETARQDKLGEKRVAAILKINGWHQQRKWEKGNALRVWVRKVENSNGSNGSSGSTQTQQGFEHDPLEKNLMDHLDQYEQVELLQPIQQSISDPLDPLEKNLMDHPEPSHSKLDPDDPLDPLDLPNFSEKNNVHSKTTTPTTRPPKCRYYQIVEVEPSTFKIETDFGTVSVSAEPYHRFGTGESKIWFEFQTPEGQTLTKSIKGDPDERVLPRLAKECGVIQQWQERRRKEFSSKIETCKFKVRILGEEDYEWIDDCTLQGVPNSPSSTHFIFKTPKNTVATAYFGEFEET
ncbi:MAG: VapE family protein [Nostoc sp. DedQUE05]|uniref:VapE domain-containing protein n=1 Tax=Nostoc sp. DedQUE05 TaxID=3075391 RepID=UPI002AD2F049|nr:VapE domain-containing protein [Nostoc sp. DedQUE05]MDZ8096392.1 VapE family protein [Nostoc sp. DedQUE05]